MNKLARAGYMMTIEDAMKFWERCQEAEKAMGAPLTREERETLLQAMKIGQELSLEELLDALKGKKVLMVHDKRTTDESL